MSAPATLRSAVRAPAVSPLRIAVVIFLWVATAALLLLTLARWTGLDQHSSVLIAFTTAAPLVLLPAYGIAAVAGFLLNRVLTSLALVLVLAQLHVMAPLVLGGRGLSAAQRAPTAQKLRLLALNVEFDHDTGAAVTRQVVAAKPDIVVLSELSDLTLKHLDLRSFPYSAMFPDHHSAWGGGIWSRFPLRDVQQWDVDGTTMVRGWVDLPDGQPLRLYQIHTKAPTGAYGRLKWKEQFPTLRAALAAETGPVIAAGDFNASRSDKPFSSLLGGPLDFADAADGRGLLPTWPSGRALLPPIFRLDHVLVSRAIGVRDVDVLGPTGSDHRAVVADLSLAKPG